MELTVENPALAARAADICRGTFKVRKTDRWADGGESRRVARVLCSSIAVEWLTRPREKPDRGNVAAAFSLLNDRF